MASNPRYDADKIDYGKVYFKIDPDPAIRPAFTAQGKPKTDTEGDHEIRETLTLVRIGCFREPSGKVDRPVFQSEQVHAYDTAELAKFKKCTKAVDVATVVTNGKPAEMAAKVAGF